MVNYSFESFLWVLCAFLVFAVLKEGKNDQIWWILAKTCFSVFGGFFSFIRFFEPEKTQIPKKFGFFFFYKTFIFIVFWCFCDIFTKNGFFWKVGKNPKKNAHFIKKTKKCKKWRLRKKENKNVKTASKCAIGLENAIFAHFYRL